MVSAWTWYVRISYLKRPRLKRQINFIAKAPGLPDAPITQEGRDYQWFADLSINRPECHDFIKEMNREVLSVRAM